MLDVEVHEMFHSQVGTVKGDMICFGMCNYYLKFSDTKRANTDDIQGQLLQTHCRNGTLTGHSMILSIAGPEHFGPQEILSYLALER